MLTLEGYFWVGTMEQSNYSIRFHVIFLLHLQAKTLSLNHTLKHLNEVYCTGWGLTLFRHKADGGVQHLLTIWVNLMIYHAVHRSFSTVSHYWTQHVTSKAERHKNDFQSGNTLYSCMVSSVDRPVLHYPRSFGLLQWRHLMRHLGHVHTNADTFGKPISFSLFFINTELAG